MKLLWLLALLVLAACAPGGGGPQPPPAPLASPPATATPAPSAQDEESWYSLVVLLSEPRKPEDLRLEEALRRAYGITPETYELPPVPGGWARGFQMEGNRMVVNLSSQPYWDHVQPLLDELPERRLKKSVGDHRGWLAVDVLDPAIGAEEEALYRLIGRLLAELAGPDSTVLLRPQTGTFQLYDPGMLPVLRSHEPLDAFGVRTQTEVADLAATDRAEAELAAATAEARRRWPEFVSAWKARRPDELFGVKAEFREGAAEEHMWVDVLEVSPDSVRGTLGNDPVDVKGLKLGDPVELKVSEIEDWSVSGKQGVRLGGFSIAIVERATRR